MNIEMEFLNINADVSFHLCDLSVYKLKPDHHWGKSHPHVHLTPTHDSCLNQIKLWFSILSWAPLKGATFRSVKQLADAIENFLQVCNESAAPFEWLENPNGQKSPESKYAYIIS